MDLSFTTESGRRIDGKSLTQEEVKCFDFVSSSKDFSKRVNLLHSKNFFHKQIPNSKVFVLWNLISECTFFF